MTVFPTVLCLGETMAVVAPTERLPLEECELFRISPGGAESNVASHLSGMGLDVAWLSRLGNDPLGDRILAGLRERCLNTDWVIRDERAPTGVYFKDAFSGTGAAVYYYRAGSAASEMSVRDLAAWPLSSAAWVHTSGITAALSPSCNELVERVIDDAGIHGYKVSFDVNYRARLWDTEVAGARCLDLARKCNVVFVGLDEAQLLWPVTTAEDVADLMPDVDNLVVKDGAVEAVEFVRHPDEKRSVHRVPARLVDVVEPVGAGDAFAAGYLGNLIRGASSEARLLAGHELAAWTLGSLADYRPRPAHIGPTEDPTQNREKER